MQANLWLGKIIIFHNYLLWKMDVQKFFRNFRILSSCSDLFGRLPDTVRRIRDNCVKELSFLSPEKKIWLIKQSVWSQVDNFRHNCVVIHFLIFLPRRCSWVGYNQIDVIALNAVLFKIAWKKENYVYSMTSYSLLSWNPLNSILPSPGLISKISFLTFLFSNQS